MTKAISLNRSRTANFFKFTLKKQTPITLLATAFCLLLCPGMVLSRVSKHNAPDVISRLDMENIFIGFSVGVFVAAAAVMLLLVLINFGFLFSKKSGDLFQSLPLSRNELLFTRLAASFIGATFPMTLSYLGLALVNATAYVIPVSFERVALTYGVMLLMLLMFTAFTSIFAVCSGGIFDFIIALGGINIGLPVVYLIFQHFLDSRAYGVELASRTEGIQYTTPYLFGLYNVISVAENEPSELAKDFLRSSTEVSLLSLILTLLLIGASAILVSRLFAKRRSETAGEAYSYPLMPHIISLLVSICGGYLLGYIFTSDGFESSGFWLFFIIGITLCSITAGAIFSRGFKTIKLSLIRSGIATVISVTVCLALLLVAGRIEGYIPEHHQIKKITIGYSEDVTFEDDFDIITSLHAAVLEEELKGEYINDKSTENTFVGQFDSLRVKYYLKSGRVVERRYYGLLDSVYDEYFVRYGRSEQYLKQFEEFEITSQSVELTYNEIDGETGNWMERRLAIITPAEAKTILDCYLTELKRADESVLQNEACDVLSLSTDGMGKYDSLSGIRIPKSFCETRWHIKNMNLMDEATFYGK